MLGPISEPANDNARQTVLTLKPHHVIAIDDRVEDQATIAVRDQFAPVFDARRGNGRLANAEILSARGVGHNEKPVPVVLDVVFVPLLARSHDAQRLKRGIGVDEIDFARLMIVSVDENEFRRLRER